MANECADITLVIQILGNATSHLCGYFILFAIHFFNNYLVELIWLWILSCPLILIALQTRKVGYTQGTLVGTSDGGFVWTWLVNCIWNVVDCPNLMCSSCRLKLGFDGRLMSSRKRGRLDSFEWQNSIHVAYSCHKALIMMPLTVC